MSENHETGKDSSETFSIPDTREVVEIERDTLTNINKLALLMERMRLSEYLALMTRPGKIIYFNFLAGMARGLGFGLGMTILLGLALYLLGKSVDLPLIGQYAADFIQIIQKELKEIGTADPMR